MIIDLQKLQKGFLKLSEGYTRYLKEACVVCLNKQNHKPGGKMTIEGHLQVQAEMKWELEVDDVMKRSHGDLQEATEYGATAIALLIAEEHHGFTIAERASKGLGFDYYLKEENEEDDLNLFEGSVRIEISGLLEETTNNSLEKRVKAKVDQISKSNHLEMEGHVCVTEFGQPKTKYIVLEQ